MLQDRTTFLAACTRAVREKVPAILLLLEHFPMFVRGIDEVIVRRTTATFLQLNKEASKKPFPTLMKGLPSLLPPMIVMQPIVTFVVEATSGCQCF